MPNYAWNTMYIKKGDFDKFVKGADENQLVDFNVLVPEPEEITNKLGDRYSLKDVDNICEDLRAYKINVSKLPFVLDNNSVIKVNESKTILSKATPVNDDDYVDEDTYKIVNRL